MDVTTARLEVRARLGELVEDFWKDNEILRALNEGQRRFCAVEKWPWLYTVGTDTLTAGDTDLALTAGVSFARHFQVNMMFDDDPRPRIPRRLTPAEGFQLERQYYTPGSEPLCYYLVSEAVANSNEIQHIANVGSTSGTFTISYDGQTTGTISRAATATAIEDALKALSNIGASDIRVYGGPLGTASVYVEFIGALGGTNVPAMTLNATNTNMSVTTDTGGAGTSSTFVSTIRFLPELSRDADISYLYIRDPRNLVADTDAIDIPDEFAMGAVDWATGHLWLKELQDARKADDQFALYAQVVDDCRRETRKLVPDEDFAWGRNAPEPLAPYSESEWVLQHIPPTLGV